MSEAADNWGLRNIHDVYAEKRHRLRLLEVEPGTHPDDAPEEVRALAWEVFCYDGVMRSAAKAMSPEAVRERELFEQQKRRIELAKADGHIDESGRYTNKAWYAFLTAFAETGSMAAACEASHVSVSAVLDRKRSNEAFAKAFEIADTVLVDRLEGEAIRRAMDGRRGGDADKLLMFLLKGRKRDVYGDKVETRNTNLNVETQAPAVDLTQLSDEQLETLVEIEAQARVDGSVEAEYREVE